MKFFPPLLLSLTVIVNPVKSWELGKVYVSGMVYMNLKVEDRHGTEDKLYFNLEDDQNFRRLQSMKTKRANGGSFNCESTTVYDKNGTKKFTSQLRFFNAWNDNEVTGGDGPSNLGRAHPIVNSYTFDVGDYFTISFKDTGFPIFEYKDYSIKEPVVEVSDGEGPGSFTIDLAYSVGAFADNMQVTLYNQTCGKEVSEGEKVVELSTMTRTFNSTNAFERYVQLVNVNTKYFSGSNLLTWGDSGESSGTLAFCARGETLLGDLSLEFIKSDISVSFDLTQNTFSVLENSISANDVDTTETNVTTAYGVQACTCQESNDCDNQDTTFQQNGLIYVCVYPDDESLSSTVISNLNMDFVQYNDVIYTAVTSTTDGPAPSSLSNIAGSGERYRVANRLITALFDGDKTSFNITGNAYLSFKASRHLKAMHSSNLRSIQEVPNVENAGESQFQMSVKIGKDNKVSSGESNPMVGAMFSIVGVVALSIMFVLFKKLTK